MSELSLCEQSGVLRTFSILGTIISIIKVVIPVVLLIICTKIVIHEYMTEGDIVKCIKEMLSKLCLGLIVFFVPSIVEAFLSMLGGYSVLINELKDCNTCFWSGNNETCQNSITVASEKEKAILEAKKAKEAKEREERQAKLLMQEQLSKAQSQSSTYINYGQKGAGATSQQRIFGDGQMPGYAVNNNITPLGMPYYDQSIFAAYNPNDTLAQRIATSGCGYVSLSNIISYFTNSSVTAYDLLSNNILSYSKCSYPSGYCMASPSLIFENDCLSQYKNLFKANMLFSNSKHPCNSGIDGYGYGDPVSDENIQKEKIYNALKAGHPLILRVTHHYISVSGMDENGLIYVQDSGRSGQAAYTIDGLFEWYGDNFSTNVGFNSDNQIGILQAIVYCRVDEVC